MLSVGSFAGASGKTLGRSARGGCEKLGSWMNDCGLFSWGGGRGGVGFLIVWAAAHRVNKKRVPRIFSDTTRKDNRFFIFE